MIEIDMYVCMCIICVSQSISSGFYCAVCVVVIGLIVAELLQEEAKGDDESEDAGVEPCGEMELELDDPEWFATLKSKNCTKGIASVCR